jgi:hypothetical protein
MVLLAGCIEKEINAFLAKDNTQYLSLKSKEK